MKPIVVYVEWTPEHYDSDPAIIIRCKHSESDIEEQIICALADANDKGVLKNRFIDKRENGNIPFEIR